MEFSTEIRWNKPIPFPKRPKPLPLSKIGFLGSCFADNIGSWFSERHLESWSNPFGTVYNPVALRNQLQTLLQLKSPSFYEHNGLHGCWQFNTLSQFPTRMDSENYVQECIQKFQTQIANTQQVVLSLGTTGIFLRQGEVVTNCQRLPTSLFEKGNLSLDQCTSALQKIIELLQEQGVKTILFTLSPIRYPKEGLAGNSLDKATLRLAIEKSCELQGVEYFPAGEILLDELRDHRFYDKDLLHPSQEAIELIRNRFLNWAYAQKDLEKLKERDRLFRQSLHRPLR